MMSFLVAHGFLQKKTQTTGKNMRKWCGTLKNMVESKTDYVKNNFSPVTFPRM